MILCYNNKKIKDGLFMIHYIENEYLKIGIKEDGAELTSLISKETEIDSLFFFVNNSQYENTGKGSRCSISTSISPNQIIITESDSGYGDWGGILRQPKYELSWEIYYK